MLKTLSPTGEIPTGCRVTVQGQNAAGEWNDVPYEQPVLLAAGAPLAAKWVHKHQRLIVDEIDT